MGHIPRIGEHALHVSTLSYFIAKEFFGDEERALFAAIGGMLHDIGFVVPKVSSVDLSADVEELYSIESSRRMGELHTVVGGYILSNFLGLYEYSDIAFYHHLSASELDFSNPTHIVANLVGVADTIATNYESFGVPVDKNRISGILEEKSERFFPEILKAAKTAISRDYTWWSLENPPDFYFRYIMPSFENVERTPKEMLLEIGYFIAYVVDSKSPFTRKHSERIADISRALGEEMDVKDPEDLYLAGLFHDVGKLAIDTSILEKPGPLSEKEYWYMRKHIFYTMKFLQHFTREGYEWPIWSSQHHERLDGKGYPLGLKGDEIPLQSRILQVADVFVALTEERPYRTPMSFEEAIGFLSKEVSKGKMDPDVLSALERIVENGYTYPKKTPISEIIETVDFLMKTYGGIP